MKEGEADREVQVICRICHAPIGRGIAERSSIEQPDTAKVALIVAVAEDWVGAVDDLTGPHGNASADAEGGSGFCARDREVSKRDLAIVADEPHLGVQGAWDV